MNRKELRQGIAMQKNFIETLASKLSDDIDRNMDREPTFSWHTIANRTQMIADARRIRRELSELIKLLQEEPE